MVLNLFLAGDRMVNARSYLIKPKSYENSATNIFIEKTKPGECATRRRGVHPARTVVRWKNSVTSTTQHLCGAALLVRLPRRVYAAADFTSRHRADPTPRGERMHVRLRALPRRSDHRIFLF